MEKVNIHILVGLPGSGKTSWANEQLKWHSDIYDLDKEIKARQYTNENIREALLNSNYPYAILNNNDVYVDGLILTQSAVETVVETTFEALDSYRCTHKPTEIVFIIEQWDLNRCACIINDAKRINEGERDLNSQAVIKNAPLDEIDIHVIESKTGITLNTYPSCSRMVVTFKVNEHTVVAYGDEDAFVYKYSPRHDGKLCSDSWSQGGHWGDCWGNEGTISAEEPAEFTELDDLLSNVCPNITYLQYKNMFSKCVHVEEFGEAGYYGTYEHKARYECDLQALYEWLKEHNFIEK